MVGDNNEDVWIVSDVPTRVDVDTWSTNITWLMFSRFVLFFLLGCSGLSYCLIETLKKVAGRFLLALPVDIKYVMRRVTGSTSEKTSFPD